MQNPDITERQAAEMAIIRLAAIVESSDDAIIGKDLNGIITSWNKGAEKIYGYSANEMVGASILRLIPPERQAEEDYILGKIRRGEKVEHFETVRRTKDGRLIDISVTVSPIKDAAGNIIGASKIGRDISVQKTHEQEILRMSRLYAALSQINQAIVWTRQRDELFEKICRVLVEFGKFSMAWIGQADAETRRVNPVARWGDKSGYLSQVEIYMDERPEGQGPVGTAIREGKSFVCNDFAQNPNTLPWHDLAKRAGFRALAAFPIRQSGAICGAVMVYSEEIGFFRDKEIALLEEAALDVSFALDYLLQDEKRQQAEQAMRVSEERYRALFDRSLDCVFLNDFDGKFLDANQAALDLLGYRREDIATLTFASLLTEDQLPLALQVTEEIKTTGHQMHPMEFRLRGKDGRQVYVETQSSLIYRDGKAFAIQGIARDLTGRKQAEKELRKSEEKFSRIFESSPMAMALSTLDEGRYLDVNQEFLKMLQRTRDEVIGRTASELGIWRNPEERAEHIVRLKKNQNVLRAVELEIRGKSGQVTQILWSAEVMVIGGKNCLLGSLLDITERKRAEQLLLTSEQRLNAFFTSAPAGLVLLDKELRYMQLNETVAKINGVPMKDHLGKTVREVLPKVAPAAEPLLQKVLATGEPMLNVELSGETPSQPGMMRYFLESFFPIMGKDGRPDGVGAIFVEITERKQAEQELQWKTALLEAQVESSLDGILVVDTQGKQILQNQRMRDLWKIPPEISENNDDNAQLKEVVKLLKNPDQFMAKITHLYSHTDELSRDEIELIDGMILDRYSSPVRGRTGKYYGRIWIFRDITTQRKLEMQFRQSQKMEAFGQLAGGVAHDFNNILAVIQLQAGLLKLEATLSSEQLEFAGDIEKAAERGANLTRQLLLFSRKQTMQPRNLKLKDVVDNMTKMLARTLGEQVQLQVKFAAEPLVIHADPGMIDQILLNLVVNARDAMPKGGQIIIETSAVEFDEVTSAQTVQARPGLFACLSVSDTGCGISPEILPRIFEPFFTTKEVGKGTGLGLATVYGIVQQHQGWINVYSEVGRGTTFRVYLPRQTKATDTEFFWSSRASMRVGSETILLVEDEPAVRSSVRITLTRLGYRVLEAANGNEALAVWKQHRDEIRLLVTDLVMPGGMTGKELAQNILKQNPNLKIIYSSGYSVEVAGKNLPLEEGVNFLAKPFKANELAQTIRDNLDKSG